MVLIHSVRCLCYFGATLVRYFCYFYATFFAMFVLFWSVFGAVYFTYTAHTPRKYRKKESAGGLDIQKCMRTPCFDTDVRLWNVLSTSKTPRIFNQANLNKNQRTQKMLIVGSTAKTSWIGDPSEASSAKRIMERSSLLLGIEGCKRHRLVLTWAQLRISTGFFNQYDVFYCVVIQNYKSSTQKLQYKSLG